MKLKYDVKVNAAKNIGLLCSVTLLSVLAASCGKSSTTNSAAPGGGEPTPPPAPGTANNLTAQTPGAAACGSNFCILSEVTKQKVSLPVTFKLDTATADQLVVSITPKIGSAKEWTTSCPTSTISSSVTCTVTYTPTTSVPEGKNTATLSYTYRNNLSNTVTASSTLPLTYEAAALFSSKKLAAAIDFSKYSQMSFSSTGGTVTSTFGLIKNSGPTSNSFYDLIHNQVVSSVAQSSYAQAPFGNNAVFADVNGNVYIYNADSKSTTTLSNNITSYALDASNIYGSNSSGQIYSSNSSTMATPTPVTTVADYPGISFTVADNTLPILYTISEDNSFNEVICATSTTAAEAGAKCLPTTTNYLGTKYQNQIAADRTIYVQTDDGTTNQIRAYIATQNAAGAVTEVSLSTTFTAITLAKATKPVSMTYDKTNKILYAIIPSAATVGSYNLAAYNATNGAALWTSPQTFTSPSSSFVTNSGTAVLLIASNGIFGFTSTGAAAFISGYSLPFPQVGTPALQLVTADSKLSNTLDIPATLTAGDSAIYSMNTNW